MSQPDIEIRAASAEDAASMHAMIKAMAESMGMGEQVHSSPDDFLRHGFGNTRCFEALIAERNGKPVGMSLYFFSFSSWVGKRGVYLQDIYVDKSARGAGLGHRLLAETARQAAQQGAEFMRLAVDKDNQAARDFYTNAGMIHADRDCIYKAWDERFETLQRF
jgi:ribosomal protein S18 acetylase RimI-like enzyme